MEEGLDDPRLPGEWFAVAWSREVVAWAASRSQASGPRRCAVAVCGKAFTVGAICASIVERSFRWADCAAIGWCARIMRGNTTRAASVCSSLLNQTSLLRLKARAQTYQAREHYGIVWVCCGRTVGDLPHLLMVMTPRSA